MGTLINLWLDWRYGPGHQRCAREEVRSKLGLRNFWGYWAIGVNSRECLRPQAKGAHLEHLITAVIFIVSRAIAVIKDVVVTVVIFIRLATPVGIMRWGCHQC